VGIPEGLRVVAQTQGGVVSRRQVLAAGLTKAGLAWQLDRGRWQPLYRGVYAMFTGQPDREAVLWAAVLWAGQDAMLSHHSAAELACLIDEPGELIHVTVPAARRVRSAPGLVIHTSLRAGRARHPSLLPPRTRIEETVLDLAGLAATFDDACGWVTRACGRRLTTEERLREAMALRSRQRWGEALGPLLADSGGGLHSLLEYRYDRDVERAHGLPRARRQVRVVTAGRSRYRDVLYEKYRLVVELDGRLAHRNEDRWRDIRRDNAAAADGCITLRYSWLDVTRHPCRTATEVAQVLTSRGWPGPWFPCPRCDPAL
jgi:very-short-patch-repair endonuclease